MLNFKKNPSFSHISPTWPCRRPRTFKKHSWKIQEIKKSHLM